jgi:hypothetical protein
MIRRYYPCLESGVAAHFNGATVITQYNGFKSQTVYLVGTESAILNIQTTYYLDTNGSGLVDATFDSNTYSMAALGESFNIQLDSTGNKTFLLELQGEPTMSNTNVRVTLTITSVSNGTIGMPNTFQSSIHIT